MRVAIDINFAIWGMAVCAGLKLANWLAPLF
jgi:hypothetical protein